MKQLLQRLYNKVYPWASSDQSIPRLADAVKKMDHDVVAQFYRKAVDTADPVYVKKCLTLFCIYREQVEDAEFEASMFKEQKRRLEMELLDNMKNPDGVATLADLAEL